MSLTVILSNSSNALGLLISSSDNSSFPTSSPLALYTTNLNTFGGSSGSGVVSPSSVWGWFSSPVLGWVFSPPFWELPSPSGGVF